MLSDMVTFCRPSSLKHSSRILELDRPSGPVLSGSCNSLEGHLSLAITMITTSPNFFGMSTASCKGAGCGLRQNSNLISIIDCELAEKDDCVSYSGYNTSQRLCSL